MGDRTQSPTSSIQTYMEVKIHIKMIRKKHTLSCILCISNCPIRCQPSWRTFKKLVMLPRQATKSTFGMGATRRFLWPFGGLGHDETNSLHVIILLINNNNGEYWDDERRGGNGEELPADQYLFPIVLLFLSDTLACTVASDEYSRIQSGLAHCGGCLKGW